MDSKKLGPSKDKNRSSIDYKIIFVIISIIYLILFLGLPLFYTFHKAFTYEDKPFFELAGHLITFPLYRNVLLNTLVISFYVTASTLFIGYPVAFILAHSSPKYERIIISILISSMWLSILVRSYTWMAILQRHGPFSEFMQLLRIVTQPVSFLFKKSTVVLGMTHILLPYMIFVIWISMKYQSTHLKKVAIFFGASRTLYFFRIFFPISRTGITAGVLLIFLLSIGYFITPALLGGGKGDTMMIAMLIEEQMNTLGRWAVGASLSILLLIFIIILMSVTWSFPGVKKIWLELFSGR